MDTQVVVVVEVQVVPVEEVVVKEEAAVVVQGVAVRQEAHQRAQALAQEALPLVQEGNLGLTRVPLLAVVQGGLAGEMQQVDEEVVQVEEEEEEEEGKVQAVEEALRPPLEGSQAMVPPTETTPSGTTMDLLLGPRPSLVMAPLVGTEASHPSTATTGKAGSSGKSTSNRSSKTLRLRRGQRLLKKKKRNMANISDG